MDVQREGEASAAREGSQDNNLDPGCVCRRPPGVSDADPSDADAGDADPSDADAGDADDSDSDASDADASDADASDSDASDSDASDADASDADASDSDASADASDADASDADASGVGAGDTGASDAQDDGNSTASILLAQQGADCLQCAQTVHQGLSVSCLAQFNCEMLGLARSPSGQSREQLCFDTLDCALHTNCEANDENGCYCGTAVSDPVACQVDAGAANGACVGQERAGLETTDPMAIVVTHWNELTYGAGMANSLIDCLSSYLSNCSCFNAQP